MDPLKRDEFDLLVLGKILWDAKYEIARNVFIVSVLAVIFAFMLPKTYRSTALLMPPSQNASSGLLNSLNSLPFGNFMSPSGDESQSSIAILKSRNVMESVVDSFDLVNVYDCETVEKAVIGLSESVGFSIEDEGTIKIATTHGTGWFHPDEEEELARNLTADMANYFVKELDRVSKELKTQQASFQRQFIERRYLQNLEDLESAENNLLRFQEENQMIALPEQTRVAIEAAAEIKGLILANHVSMEVYKSTLNEDHPDVKRLQKETEELQKQLNRMQNGAQLHTQNSSGLFPTFTDVPKLGVDLIRLQREVEVQNTLFIYLTQQYEEAKIKEAKDTPTVQVLDHAIPHQLKYKPQRFRVLLIGVVFSSLLSAYWVYFRARFRYKSQLPNP